MKTVSTKQLPHQPLVSSYIIQQQYHSRESSSDSLNLITSSSSSSSEQQNYIDMPLIYKQPLTKLQPQQNKNNNNKQLFINTNNNNNNSNKISTGTFVFNNLARKDSNETLDSISSTNSIKLATTPHKNTSSSSSSSSVSSSTAVKYEEYETINMQIPLNNNTTNNANKIAPNNNQYDDDIDFLPSPTSSGIPTSPSVLSYLSTSSTTPNNNNNNNNASANNTSYIPTRYFDRRVSQSAIQQDPYKFNVNYSEAGSHLARAAQEQLKIAEKIKEAKKEAQKQQLEQLNNAKKDSEDTGEDWQNVSLIDFNNLLINFLISIVS